MPSRKLALAAGLLALGLGPGLESALAEEPKPAGAAAAPATSPESAAAPGAAAGTEGPVAAAAPKAREDLTLETFAAHPQAALPSLSPDGRELAVVLRAGGKRLVVIRPALEGVATQPRAVGAVRSRPLWLRWTKDRVLLSVERFQHEMLMDATEEPVRPPTPIFNRRGQVVGYDIGPQPLRKEFPAGRVTYVYAMREDRMRDWHLGRRWEDPVPIQDDVLSWLPADPRRVLISYDPAERIRGQVARPTVMSMSISTGAVKRVVRDDEHVQRWHADWNGEVRLGEADVKGAYVLFRRDGSKVVPVPTYVSALESDVRFAAYTPDPDVIYAWGPVQGRQALLTLRLSTGKADGVFAHPEVDVTGPLIFDDAHHLVAVGYVDDVPRLQVLDEKLAREREAMERALPDLVIEPVSESGDHRLVVVRASSDVRSPRYFLFDRAKRELSEEFSEYPTLDDAQLAPMERVTVWARDGLGLPSYLTRPLTPPASGKPPAIVLVHDGPGDRAMKRFDPLVQWLARRGYAVLEPNYRGSSGYGTKFLSLGFGQWNGAMQDDLDDAAAWLAGQGIADPARIAIFGRGYGGYAALMAVARSPSKFVAAASYGAPTDLVELLEDDERDRVESDWSRSVLGLRPRDDARLREISPLFNVAKISKPVLLMHAERDQHVRSDQAEELAEALEKAGKPAQLVILQDELYEPADEANRVLLFQSLTEFLNAQLGAAAAPPAPPAEKPLG